MTTRILWATISAYPHMPLAATDNIDLVFRAFSDRTRLRILNLLRGREEICVCDLVRVLGQPQAKVSRHLAYLRKAGLVAGRRERQWMHYRLIAPRNAFRKQLISCLDCCVKEVPMLKRDRVSLGKCCSPDSTACCNA